MNPSCDGLSLTRVDGEKFCGSDGQELGQSSAAVAAPQGEGGFGWSCGSARPSGSLNSGGWASYIGGERTRSGRIQGGDWSVCSIFSSDAISGMLWLRNDAGSALLGRGDCEIPVVCCAVSCSWTLGLRNTALVLRHSFQKCMVSSGVGMEALDHNNAYSKSGRLFPVEALPSDK